MSASADASGSCAKSLPAPTDRTTASRLPYPSQAEFAAMVGTDRFRVIDWEHGAIPDRREMQELREQQRQYRELEERRYQELRADLDRISKVV